MSLKKKQRDLPKDIDVTLSVRRKKSPVVGKKRWYVFIGDTILGAMHNFGSSPKIGIEFVQPKLFGYEKEDEAIQYMNTIKRYIDDFINTPQDRRPGSSKYWYRRK